MRIRDLKKNGVSVWPPSWASSYGRGSVFATGEDGVLIHAEAHGDDGVTVMMDFDSRHHTAVVQWTGLPDVSDVLQTLESAMGRPIREVSDVEIEETPRETADERCPYCGSGNVSTLGSSHQAGRGNPVKEAYDCLACGRHFRRIRVQRPGE